jgi:hypothetical protein
MYLTGKKKPFFVIKKLESEFLNHQSLNFNLFSFKKL